MTSTDAIEASDGLEGSFTKVLLTVQTLEEELAGTKESAKRAISERDASQNKAKRLESELAGCRSEMQKAVSDLQNHMQHWTAQAKADESEKVESSKRAAALALQLESLRSTRDKNYQALKEKHSKADLEMELKRDECDRMQKQLKSYAGLLSALETELVKTRQAFADAKALVSENCRLVSRQEEKLQKVIVAEDRFLGKINRQAAGFKTLRARLQEKEQALKELAAAHDTAARQLASSKNEAADLRRTVELLGASEKEQIAAKNTLHRSLQRSIALLAEAHSASEQHRATLDSLRQKLRALDAEALGRAASDAATVKQQGQEIAALQFEVEKLRGQLTVALTPEGEVPIIREAPKLMTTLAAQNEADFDSNPAAQPAAAQPALHSKGEECRQVSEAQMHELLQPSQLTGRRAIDMDEDHREESCRNSAAQSELRSANAAAASAPNAPAAKPDHANKDTIYSSGPASISQTVCLSVLQQAAQSVPKEPDCPSRREVPVSTADTPDELEIDGDEEMPQRLQLPQLAQPSMHGGLWGMGFSRDQLAMPSVSSDKDKGGSSVPSEGPKRAEPSPLAAAETPSAGLPAKRSVSSSKKEGSLSLDAEDLPNRAGVSSLAADAPSAGLKCTEDSKVHVSAAAGEQSAMGTATAHQTGEEQSSAPSGPRAKKPRMSETEMQRDTPSLKGETNGIKDSCSPCDLFASFSSLQDLSDDEDAPTNM